MSTRRGNQHRTRRTRSRQRFVVPVYEPCGQCGRLLSDARPDEGPTMSVEIAGRVLFACPDCVPCLRELVAQSL